MSDCPAQTQGIQTHRAEVVHREGLIRLGGLNQKEK